MESKLHPRCPIRTTLEMLGGKWRLLIVQSLAEKPIRYSALKKAVPDISEKMLAQELKILIDYDLVHRKNFGEVPPRVEYSLTEKGKKALPLIDSLAEFGIGYMNELS